MAETLRDYEAQQQARYDFSMDEETQLRLLAIHNTAKTLKRSFSAFAGFTLEGSLVKGKTLPATDIQLDTDIDLNAFIDYDELLKNPKMLFDGMLTDQQRALLLYLRWHHLKPYFLTGESTSEEMDRVIQAEDIIEKLTDEGVHTHMFGLTNNIFKHPSVDCSAYIIAREGKYSILDTVRRYEAALLTTDEVSRWSNLVAVASPFGLSLGGTMTPYRNSFFNSLDSLPDGENLWRLTRGALIDWERRGTLTKPLEREFPRTLAGAKAYYRGK